MNELRNIVFHFCRSIPPKIQTASGRFRDRLRYDQELYENHFESLEGVIQVHPEIVESNVYESLVFTIYREDLM